MAHINLVFNRSHNNYVEHLAVHGYGDDVFIFALSTDKLRVWSVRKKVLVASLMLIAKTWESQEPAQSKHMNVIFAWSCNNNDVFSSAQGNEILG